MFCYFFMIFIGQLCLKNNYNIIIFYKMSGRQEKVGINHEEVEIMAGEWKDIAET